MSKPRKSYLRGLQDELSLATQHNLDPKIITEISGRIEELKAYKRNYHKRTYRSKRVLDDTMDTLLSLDLGQV